MSTIGLCMIVKNEARLIWHCLNSVLPLIDYVLVVDTGSTDGTQEIIERWLLTHNIPGRVVEEPWQNFAYNRSFALGKLREVRSVDYALIMDADDKLALDSGFDVAAFKAALDQDVYMVPIKYGVTSYSRDQLCRNDLDFYYRGVVHEYLEHPLGCRPRAFTSGFHIVASTSGARSADPQKYAKDAAVLEEALAMEKDDFLRSRYVFYLAQSYRDCGEREKAFINYAKRITLGYWHEEVFICLLELGRIQEYMKWPYEAVIDTWTRASKVSPYRAGESWYECARYCRTLDKFEEGYQFAVRGLAVPMPENGLFVQNWVYEYGLLDELSVHTYWTGRYSEALMACERLMEENKFPLWMLERVAKNLEFSTAKVRERAA